METVYRNPFFTLNEEGAAWFGNGYLACLDTFVRSATKGYYRTLAQQQSRKRVRYFVEKAFQTIARSSAAQRAIGKDAQVKDASACACNTFNDTSHHGLSSAMSRISTIPIPVVPPTPATTAVYGPGSNVIRIADSLL